MDQLAIPLLLANLLLLAWIAYSLRAHLKRAPDDVRAQLQEICFNLSQASNSLNNRIDNMGQALNSTLATALQQMTQNLTSAISSAREETRLKLEDRLADFREDLRASFERLQMDVNSNLAQGRKEMGDTLMGISRALEERFDRLQASNESKLKEIRENVERRLDENIEKNLGVFKEMSEKIVDLKATNERIMEISKDINLLNSILQSPKLRGNIGEFELENMLRQIIPAEHYRMQYAFDGVTADAALLLPEDKILCIDSKFPLDNFRRMLEPSLSSEQRGQLERQFCGDVRQHIDAIASKYVVPPRTLEFAFMFIPAENIYYEILVHTDLHQYALAKRVIPVSPNTLYAYLHALAFGFRGLKIQQETRRIGEMLAGLKVNLDNFKDRFRKLGKHLDNARSQFAEATVEVERFEQTISGLNMGRVEPAELPASSETTDSGRLSDHSLRLKADG